jgi:Ca2+-binding RTX toxin-like protein
MHQVRAVGLITIVTAFLAAPAPARAASAPTMVSVRGDLMTATAAHGVVNDVSVQLGSASGTFDVSDTAGVLPGAGCVSTSGDSAECSGDVGFIQIHTRDLGDRIVLRDHGSAYLSVDAGAGDDKLTGSNGRDALNGGGGDDAIDGRAGTDYLDGGPGADVLDGGNGPTDKVYYTARTEDLHISADGVANDGAAGEGDNVLNVEDILSGSGSDTIVEYSASGFVEGNAGDDTISVAPGAAGTLLGGAGNDSLDAGSSISRLQGGTGNDALASKNGLGNIDTCGSGADTVNADTNDQVAADCEHVTKS